MGGGIGGMGDDGRPRETFAPKEREVEDLWGSQTKSGINFSKYDSIPVKTLGENKPSSITNFQTSGLATSYWRTSGFFIVIPSNVPP